MYKVVLCNEKENKVEEMLVAKFKYLDEAKDYCIKYHPASYKNKWLNIRKSKEEESE